MMRYKMDEVNSYLPCVADRGIIPEGQDTCEDLQIPWPEDAISLHEIGAKSSEERTICDIL